MPLRCFLIFFFLNYIQKKLGGGETHQKATESNIRFLGLISKSMGLDSKVYIRNSGMAGLEFGGNFVFKQILPFLQEYSEWLY